MLSLQHTAANFVVFHQFYGDMHASRVDSCIETRIRLCDYRSRELHAWIVQNSCCRAQPAPPSHRWKIQIQQVRKIKNNLLQINACAWIEKTLYYNESSIDWTSFMILTLLSLQIRRRGSDRSQVHVHELGRPGTTVRFQVVQPGVQDDQIGHQWYIVPHSPILRFVFVFFFYTVIFFTCFLCETNISCWIFICACDAPTRIPLELKHNVDMFYMYKLSMRPDERP